MKILSDSVYGGIQDKPSRAKEKTVRARPKSNGSSFATTVFTAASYHTVHRTISPFVCIV